ncbi:hypothetical protein C0585_05125 [Candidatus Woesearchaeota archaeon]|nr:MAG: hypothetical protein C0585_05125 [Candidatus Woesearchaeota archaeon]
MIYYKDVEKITLEDVESLIENEIPENALLEYKRELKIQKGDERKEFLKDVSAFANSRGGLFIFGIQESDEGNPEEIVGIEAENTDKKLLQIQEIICSGIEPIINNAKIRFLKIKDNKHILLIKIFRSWNLPHRVCYKKSDKFFIRRNNQVSRITIEELKMMFTGNEELKEKIFKFRDSRIAKKNTVFPKQTLYLHVVPIQSFYEEYKFDLSVLEKAIQNNPLIRSLQKKYNFDGLNYINLNIPLIKSIQIFRDGKIELIINLQIQDQEMLNLIPVAWINNALYDHVRNIFNFYNKIEILPPFLILMTCNNFLGKKIHLHNSVFIYDDNVFSENTLKFPDILIENVQEYVPERILPVLDLLWQACGYEKCKYPIKEKNQR